MSFYINEMNEFHIEDSPAKEYLKKLNDFSMRKVIDKFGNVFYYNEKGHIHREDGPAVEYSFGNKYWYKNGKLHREYGPAIEYVEGDK